MGSAPSGEVVFGGRGVGLAPEEGIGAGEGLDEGGEIVGPALDDFDGGG